MKILFVENRGKTYVYEQVAEELEKQGHEISWIIYNHAIKVACGSVNIIPYSKKKHLIRNKKILDQEVFEEIAKLDRYATYYGRGVSHYAYYYEKIENIIDQEQPDVVFGEMSTFYCVMCSILCENKGIPMYTEGGARYPRGRFTFNIPNKYKQISSSGDVINFNEAEQEWQKISRRQSKPEYMDRFDFNLFKKTKIKLRGDVQRLNYLFEYIKGERFYTRNLQDALKDYLIRRKNKKKWDSVSEQSINKNYKFIILFPLQMQPEFNLDVWGSEFSNQEDVIKQISSILPEEVALYVKPNPAFNLEVNELLINSVMEAGNIFCLDSKTPMEAIFEDVDMVVTVTGTISIECVFSNKPVVSLAETVASKFRGCIHLDNIDGLKNLIEMVMANDFPLADDKEKYRFYSHLLDSSHAGVISDYTRAIGGSMKKDNLEKLVLAYTKFLNQLNSGFLEFNGKENLTHTESQHR